MRARTVKTLSPRVSVPSHATPPPVPLQHQPFRIQPSLSPAPRAVASACVSLRHISSPPRRPCRLGRALGGCRARFGKRTRRSFPRTESDTRTADMCAERSVLVRRRVCLFFWRGAQLRWVGG